MSIMQAEAPALDASLRQAIQCHQAGEMAEAERMYREIATLRPVHAHASHNLGVLAMQSRRAEEALAYLRAAVEASPETGRYWLTYVEGLMQTGRLAEAAAALERAERSGVQSDALAELTCRVGCFARESVWERNLWMPDLLGDIYTSVLERLHQVVRPASYLEIGVQTGATLALARCASIGIDPHFQFGDLGVVRRLIAKPQLLLYQMPSDDFFARWNPAGLLGGPIDLAFLDGMHRCDYLLRDFVNTERHCRPGSLIVLHDCLPVELPMAEAEAGGASIDPRRAGMWTGDVWRLALLLKRRRPDLKMLTLDAAPTGLVLITGLDPQSLWPGDDHRRVVDEMLSWSLEELTLRGYYRAMEVVPEVFFRQPAAMLAWLKEEVTTTGEGEVASLSA